MIKNTDRFLLLLVMASFIAFSPMTAHAISAPGLEFQIEFQPQLIQFPADYKETYEALYAAHESLRQIPVDMAAIKAEHEKRMAEIDQNHNLNPVQLRVEQDKALADYEQKMSVLKSKNSELRDGFVFLAEKVLSEGSDPYILFFLAQQLYDIRTESTKINVVTENTTDQIPDEQTVSANGFETPTATPPAEPAKATVQQFASNYDRIVAYCNEILNRHNEFPYKDKVLHMLAVVKGEIGLDRQSIKLIALFIKRYPQSPLVGEMYFRMGEHYFKEPTGFDHFSKAVESYERALKYYKTTMGKEYWRIIYKIGWAQYLSHDMNEDAQDTFVDLYKKIDAAPQKSDEMLAIQAEVLEVLRQMKKLENMSSGSQFER